MNNYLRDKEDHKTKITIYKSGPLNLLADRAKPIVKLSIVNLWSNLLNCSIQHSLLYKGQWRKK